MDFAGTVEAVGEGVTGFAPGDGCNGCAGGLADLQGALAQFMLADARLIAHAKDHLDARGRSAAAGGHYRLRRPAARRRQSRAEGARSWRHRRCGHVAVQLARHLGADVHATCGGRQQAEIIHGYGATAIDYRTEKVADYVARHTAGAGFDVVFDTSAGPISAIHSKRPH